MVLRTGYKYLSCSLRAAGVYVGLHALVELCAYHWCRKYLNFALPLSAWE